MLDTTGTVLTVSAIFLGMAIGLAVIACLLSGTGLSVAKKAPKKRVTHIRGSGNPGWFQKAACSERIMVGEQDLYYKIFTPCPEKPEFLDENCQYWCRYHVPDTAKELERATMERDGFGEGDCVTHGTSCPKPWGG